MVAVTRLDLEADEYRSQLWAVPTDASAPARPLTTGHRDSAPGVLAGRPVAGLPERGAGRQAAGVGAAHRGRRAPPADRPPARRRGAGVVAGLPPAGLRRAGTGAGPLRDGGGRRPRAEPPRLITTLQYRLDGVGFLADRRSQVFVVDLPADFDDDTAVLPEPRQVTTGDADCADVTWRPDGARAGLRLRAAPARRPRPGPRRLRVGRRHRTAAGHRLARRLRAARLRTRRPRSTSPPSRSRAGRRRLRGPAGGALPGDRRAGADAAAGSRAAPPRRRDAGDRAGTAPSWWGSSAGARSSCCGYRWTAGRRRCWSTARSPSAGSRPGAAWWSPPWRTTGPPGS